MSEAERSAVLHMYFSDPSLMSPTDFLELFKKIMR
jgi:hypothetical protein